MSAKIQVNILIHSDSCLKNNWFKAKFILIDITKGKQHIWKQINSISNYNEILRMGYVLSFIKWILIKIIEIILFFSFWWVEYKLKQRRLWSWMLMQKNTSINPMHYYKEVLVYQVFLRLSVDRYRLDLVSRK